MQPLCASGSSQVTSRAQGDGIKAVELLLGEKGPSLPSAQISGAVGSSAQHDGQLFHPKQLVWLSPVLRTLVTDTRSSARSCSAQ